MKTIENNWFSHEGTTHAIAPMWAMRAKYGSEGYGNYWILLENFRMAEDYQLDISKPFTYGMLSGVMGMPVDKIKAWIDDCIHEFEILQTDGTYIWSDDLCGRMEYMDEKKEILRERGRKGGSAKKSKKEAQVNLSESTSSDNINLEKAHTLQTLQTEQNNTKTTITTNNTNVVHSFNNDVVAASKDISKPVNTIPPKNTVAGTPEQWETYRSLALDDTMRFVYPYVSQGKVTKDQLGAWLAAFNRTLEFQAAPMKSEQDYRKHFASWFKYHDPLKEKPENLSPVPPNKVIEDPNRPQTFMRNVHELIAEQELRRQQQDELDRLEMEKRRIEEEEQLRYAS